MTQFAVFAVLIVLTALAFVLPGLWFGQRRRAVDADRKAANLAIYRDQLAELEREQAEGSLAAEDFAQAKTELQRRMLEEVDPQGETAVSTTARSRPTAVFLLLALPLLAVAGYALLGNPAALDPAKTTAQPQMTAADIDAMVEKLAARMQDNPDDMNGWLMLARSYKMLGRYEEAVAAYAKAEKTIAEDPELLASYAETLAMASGEGLTGKALELVEQALKLDPNHAHALFLAGMAAMERGERPAAIAYWEKLLPQVEPGSEFDQMLRQGIEQMKQKAK
jgi:cytochrome c-type biogenesis protein CcmH